MPEKNALKSVLVEIALAFRALGDLDTPERAAAFFSNLGYTISGATLVAALPSLKAAADNLFTSANASIDTNGGSSSLAANFNILAAVAAVVNAMGEVQSSLASAGVRSLDEFVPRLADHLLLEHADSLTPQIHEVLLVLGLIEFNETPEAGQPKRRINWPRLGQLLTEPARIAQDVYNWNSGLDTGKLLARIERYMRASGIPGGLYPQLDAVKTALGNTTAALQELRFPIFQKGFTPEDYSQFGITFSPADATDGQKKGIALLPYIMGASDFAFDVCDRGELKFESTADIRSIGIVVRPPYDAQGILNLTSPFHAAIGISEKPNFADEMVLLGTAGGTRLSIQGLGINWFASGAREKLDLGVEATIDAVRLVIAAGEGDGFLQKVLSGVHAEAQASVGFGMTLKSGFTFRGGGKLALDLGTHLDAGPVHVTGLRLALEPSDAGFALETGAMLDFSLGPITAVAENIGLRADMRFQPGNLGPLDLSIAFKPPDGIGLALDAGGFKGGGFLRFNAERGEYAGALELDFKGLFSVKAVAVINTQMPDGSPGFSLLVLIAAEFTPIQLSFGFTLNGVGGLFGLNRAIVVSALAEGIRTNSIKSILFPEDVIANATRIISDIKQFFPPEDDHFVVGPMAKLGWGTPSIITAEVGLLLDLPNPMFAIVGVLRAVLPAEDAPVLRLQVNFIGVLDFDRGYIFFRADLYESRLLIFSITGSMAFLISWGEDQTFALSVGGFHPDFRDIPVIPALPDGFRQMARIGISLLSDDNPRLKVESYFAVTSNTVQFGAKVELYAAAADFNVYGFLGFDVLFQFDPFRFLARLYGGIALRDGDDVIAGINITAQLSGPTPWDARGTATLTILFIDIDVDFHVTWGDPPPAIESKTEDLLARLEAELADTRNWLAVLPPENHLHVTLRKIEQPGGDPAAPLVIHPAGVLTFSQRTLPLDGFLITKFGDRKPLNENRFVLSGANCDGVSIAADYQGIREQFAISQFSELSDSDKLSRPSFERLPCGFSLTGSADVQAAPPVARDVIYELSYLRRKPIRWIFFGLFRLGWRTYDRLVRSSAVRQSALAKQQLRTSMNAPPQVTLPKESFAVASVSDLTAYAQPGETAQFFGTQAEAYAYQRSLVGQNPTLVGQIQVVSHFELAA